ncbi:MAG: hypothetical protein EZS28_029556 [Streblomastix strix]|uniref:Peptidase M20 dimerisation domain-containing protein n=1 Tax=Streblomastix strix TaxID=222440 RepID=A0A5J4UW34_9EUKA|nr:MAG: hypothetical protein EZS28_029556 [Streblomastix strix]
MTEQLSGIIPNKFVMNGTTEVGILMNKIMNSQDVSFGARADNLHSIQEMLYIDTAGHIYQTLLVFISKL